MRAFWKLCIPLMTACALARGDAGVLIAGGHDRPDSSILSLAEWGAQSYLPLENNSVERLYEFSGLALAAASVWLGIKRNWDGIVNTGSAFFAIFLFSRLYHWWWDWMPKYLFFAVIGVIGILLLAILRLMRRERTEGLPA